MKLNLTDLLQASLYEFKSEGELVKLLNEVHLNFTQKRENINEYTESEKLVGAYSCFYMPTNMAKFDYLLKVLPPQICEDFKDCHFLDIGTGPGTFLLSYLNFVGAEYKNSIVALDPADLMQAQAKKNLNFFFPDFKEVDFIKNIREIKLSGKIILNFGHSLNEMGREACLEYIEKLHAQFVVFLEPGTPAVFEQMLKVRSELFKRGYDVVYPCENNGACPLDGELDWCHQIIKATHDPSIERLSQLIAKDRRSMPAIIHVYSKKKVTAMDLENFKQARYLRKLQETKFSFEWEVCKYHDEKLMKLQLQIMKRGLKNKQIKELRALRPGISVKYEVVKELPNNVFRVKLV